MSPHLIFVIRRFWPIQTGAARTLFWIARGLRTRGYRVTVVTPRWIEGWPAEFMLDEVRVTRPSEGVTDWRSVRRFARRVYSLLRDGTERIDGVFVSGLREEAQAAVRAVGGRVPVVLRAERSGPGGDCSWQARRLGGRRLRRTCAKADAVLAPSELIQKELLAAGYDPAKTFLFPHGVPLASPPDRKDREESRLALARAEPVASTTARTALVVYLGSLAKNKNLPVLLDAWGALYRTKRSARLWLAGDGPTRYNLLRQTCGMGMESRVLLPGSFSDVDDLLKAAHLLVQPSADDCMSVAVLEAMAFRRPVIAADSPGNREIVTHDETGLLFPPDSPESLAQALVRILTDAPLAERLAAAGRKRVESRYSADTMVESHARLWERLLGDYRRSNKPRTA